MDTLRLAIGYISFLAELVENDRGGADPQQRPLQQQVAPRKVVVIGNRRQYSRRNNSYFGTCFEETILNKLEFFVFSYTLHYFMQENIGSKTS